MKRSKSPKMHYASDNMKQAGAIRHIQGSKIAKGLQSVKVLVDWGPFDFFETLNAEKTEMGPFGIFQHPFCRKKSKADPWWKYIF